MLASANEALDHARRALPVVEGDVSLPGLREEVEVVRDRWGVPHIYARSTWDLFFAAGYVVTSERLFQQDFLLRVANGRLATMLSELGLPMDRFARTVGWNRAGRRITDGYDDLSHEVVQAVIAGANAWIETMPVRPLEYEVLELDPEPYPTGEEGAAYTASFTAFMAFGLSDNWDAELLRAEIGERLGGDALAALFPEPPFVPPLPCGGAGKTSETRVPPVGHGILGSNNWAVAGSRTRTGLPLLANDPHLPVQMPSIWFECHLAAPGFEVSGVTLPIPVGIQIGHTARTAWGVTNVGGDTQDLYEERLNDDGTAALHVGAWEPLSIRKERIDVRGRSEPDVLQVRETRHGPIMDSYLLGIRAPEVVAVSEGRTYALRWTGHEVGVSPATFHRMATAASFDEFREALRGWQCPGGNVVYADAEGNIGYQCTGLYPIRRKGDGTAPVPGWSGEHEWDGYVPFEDLPWCLNPEQGFVASANQRIEETAFPMIGVDFLPPHRARRIVQLLSETQEHSRESFARMQADTLSLPARDLAPLLARVTPASDTEADVLSELDGWDGDLATGSVAACIYQAWCKHLGERLLRPALGGRLYEHYHGRRAGTSGFQHDVLAGWVASRSASWPGAEAPTDDVLRAALKDAIAELTLLLGEEVSGWHWGRAHRVRFTHQLALIPDLSDLLTGGVVEVGGDAQTLNQSMFEPSAGYEPSVVASWRQIVDLSDIDASVGVLPTGQSGNPASPHWSDMVALWAAGEYHPLPFTRASVERLAEARLSLLPV